MTTQFLKCDTSTQKWRKRNNWEYRCKRKSMHLIAGSFQSRLDFNWQIIKTSEPSYRKVREWLIYQTKRLPSHLIYSELTIKCVDWLRQNDWCCNGCARKWNEQISVKNPCEIINTEIRMRICDRKVAQCLRRFILLSPSLYFSLEMNNTYCL